MQMASISNNWIFGLGRNEQHFIKFEEKKNAYHGLGQIYICMIIKMKIK